MRIIPAIDLIDGKCVRLTQGDYAQKKVYNENPLDVAKSFEDQGLQYLHLVDLDGAKAGKVTNWKVVESITAHTKLIVDFGGGIKTDDEIRKLFERGIRQVNLGSIAVKEPQKVIQWIDEFGSDKIILSADVKNNTIAISGWQESSSINIRNFLRDYIENGIEYVTCTDISTDGMLTGPNIELYKTLILSFPQLHLVASGGVGTMEDLQELKRIGVDGVIVGKAIYEGRVKLEELALL
ncbi:1-(5-phosphoribosyl)-5-[(5-phosphoribosylamino)methylideneamino]imidazole-4-carboxamide isomerase [Ohtaekwangia kribbensis]|jgi:phosphoribosylformimino-5-aminoimidazole carboxamide ribotide isomerase|uniref:1-(5-phosphoribosyl)-5-[(5-phosphoribosylamino)methylideneamino] imidazole-4-carboxamide isomerase n=1 Tax=Ohtaekwangia kribbensis TaxID=688913 RepID=A0ABW3JY57_9BACT